jgi:hypothetical protein
MGESKNVEQVVDEAIANANEKPTTLQALASWIRRLAGAQVISTVAHSDNDLGGQFERTAAYRNAAMKGIQESELTTYFETGAELRKRRGKSGASEDTPIGQR